MPRLECGHLVRERSVVTVDGREVDVVDAEAGVGVRILAPELLLNVDEVGFLSFGHRSPVATDCWLGAVGKGAGGSKQRQGQVERRTMHFGSRKGEMRDGRRSSSSDRRRNQ